MKSTILIMALVLATLAGYAQSTTATDPDAFKPQAKKVSTELNVNPFNGKINLNNSLNQIKLRYFASPSIALRLGFNVNRRDSVYNVNNPYGTNSYVYKDDRKSTTLGINFGIEKHFTGTKRLSPYIGADVSLSNRTASQETNNNGTFTTIKGGWYSATYIGNNYITSVEENAYFRYGVNLFSGFDFYVAPHLFFGYEFNLAIYKTNWKKIEVTQTGPNTNPNNNNLNNYGSNSSLSYGTSLMNGIRLGYTF